MREERTINGSIENVIGSSPSIKALVIVRFDEESFTDPQIEELYKYLVDTKQFISQGHWAGGVYFAGVFDGKMSLLINLRN
ncbi:MAG: hypothetical protein JST46_14430 [Bacteroidetes bacterium]|nr:hypothetical protein [Bacteroidota bacterium]